MTALTRADLLSLERYAVERPAFRARVIAHKKCRQLGLGAHLTLCFEDRLTIQYQVQEMLRIERIFEPGGIDDELKQTIIKKVDSNRAAFGLESGKTLQYDVSVKVSPDLLAGVRVRVADYIYDGTVARDLIHWHDVAAVHPIDAAKAFAD